MNPYYELPDSWRWIRLGDLCSRVDYGLNEEASEDGTGQVFLRISDIDDNGQLHPDSRKYLKQTILANEETFLLPGDITIARSGSIGRSFLVTESEHGWAFASYLIRFRPISELIEPEYLSRVLISQLFRGYVDRVGRSVAQPNINSKELCRFLVPLPSLFEQRRVVDLLRQTEQLTTHRKKIDEFLAKAKRQLFVELFGDPNPRANTAWPIAKLGSVVTVATGGTPSREQADSFGGSIAWVKSTDLTDAPIAKTDESITELGIQRSNAKIYPINTILLAMYGQGQTRGRTGKLLIEASCNQACAALLPNEELLPDYLLIWLQLSYDAVRSLGRGGQQENLNLDIIRNIKLPKPPVDLQREFSKRLGQLQEIVKNTEAAKQQTEALISALRIKALTGAATIQWREKHALEIQEEVQQRDELLHNMTSKPHKADEPDHRSQRAAPKSVRAKTRDSSPSQLSKPAEHGRPARHWLRNELSEFQGAVWTMLRHERPQKLVIVDDPDAFNDFCTNPQTTWPIEQFNASPNRIRRTLEQLAGLGLIAKVSVPRQNAATQQTEYLTAFRPLRDDENSRLRDAAMLKNALNGGEPSFDDSPE